MAAPVALAAALAATGCGAWGDRLACGDQGCEFTRDEWARVKALANVTATPAPPDPSNLYLPIADWNTGELAPDATVNPAVTLGRLLYFDPRLSGSVSNADTTGAYAPTTRQVGCGQVGVSCASCHDPLHAGSDITSFPRHVSIGAGWYDVNAQQTLNAARFGALYWNGRTETLWAQAAQVMESGVSMNGYRLRTFWLIVTRYRALYDAVPFTEPAAAAIDDLAVRLGTPPSLTGPHPTTDELKTQYAALSVGDQVVVQGVHVNAAKAIAAYEWLLASDNSKFDQFVQEGPESTALTDAAVRGLKLFVGRASCIDCHNTPMFSDGAFHNIGIGQTGDHVPTLASCTVDATTATTAKCDCTDPTTSQNCFPSGGVSGLVRLTDPKSWKQDFYRGGAFDQGAAPPEAPRERPMGSWRTPSLRDVASTAPYMHDGSLATLSDVVWHYSDADGAPALGTSELAPLHLEARDRDDLVAFLETLTGQTSGPPEGLGRPATLPDGPGKPELAKIDYTSSCTTTAADLLPGDRP